MINLINGIDPATTGMDLAEVSYAGTDIPRQGQPFTVTENGRTRTLAKGWTADTANLLINDVKAGIFVTAAKDARGNAAILIRGTDNLTNAYADGAIAKNPPFSAEMKARIVEYAAIHSSTLTIPAMFNAVRQAEGRTALREDATDPARET